MRTAIRALPIPELISNGRPKSVVQLVAGQAQQAPNALAVNAGSYSVNYHDLNVAANRLAHYLVNMGVGPDSIVGICLERSPEAVIAALAVFKAGGAYLPLDPAYPRERLALMLNDSQPRVVLTRHEVLPTLPDGDWRVVTLEDEQHRIDSFPTTAPLVLTQPDNLAYVIYTSGSTGEPKGVEITHNSLLNLINWHQEAFEITNADRASLLASVGFDASVWEAWPYLTAGASLHLPADEIKTSPELLRDWLVDEGITVSFLPTVLAERLMQMAWPFRTSLRFLLTGADTLRRFPTTNLPFSVINNYGPTECTVVATSGVVTPGLDRETLPTIGKPIRNTTIYLLDAKMQRVAPGDAGEIYIGGEGVARGYLNRPELTRERFVEDPFSREANAIEWHRHLADGPGITGETPVPHRLYRTGDLARMLPNGEIAYVGRVDDQIKVMGYRIEPNEIIAVLNRHPEVETSVVVARDIDCSEKQLAAYVVLAQDSDLGADGVRDFLRRELPDYMVPSIFVRIDSLPLNQNGKVDRGALPAPDADNTLWEQEFTAPRTPLESKLAEMLSTLLGIDAVSVNDNFFLLGGHSLLGTQLIGQIRGVFGVDLALRSLFDSPTIAQLAFEVERLLQAKIAAMSEEEVEQLLATAGLI
ncbi:MAG TPA: non-ribosomal peptide synthetase [Pyrinomonadaceae bacterium]|nr:non-ribosomal peptide synthetase [Pyrinomonadaceae bacterium]